MQQKITRHFETTQSPAHEPEVLARLCELRHVVRNSIETERF